MRGALALLCLAAIGCVSSPAPEGALTETLRHDLGGLRTETRPTGSTGSVDTHRVQRGETLWGIARRWGVTVADLKQANALTTDTIYAGQELVIPSVRHVRTSGDTDEARPAWPVPGLRECREDGDALIIYAPEDTSVVAAATGRVNYMSEQVRGLGTVVMLEHSGGLLTFYGRLEDVAVTVGQAVRKGDPVGRVAPGGAIGPQLHFMVFRDGKAISARDYLGR